VNALPIVGVDSRFNRHQKVNDKGDADKRLKLQDRAAC
jgi:hypothetical protein